MNETAMKREHDFSDRTRYDALTNSTPPTS